MSSVQKEIEQTDDIVEVELVHLWDSNKRHGTQPVVLTRPESGLIKIPATCNICNKETRILVPSRSRALRFGRIFRIVFIIVAILFLVFMLWFGLVVANPDALGPVSTWIIFSVIFSIIIAGLPFILSPLISKRRLVPYVEASNLEAKSHLVVESKITRQRQISVPNQQSSRLPGELRVDLEETLKLARYLATCGKFDREKVATFLSMAEQSGIQFPPQEKSRMLNADTLILPKRQSDGTFVDAFQQIRMLAIETMNERLLFIMRILSKLPPETATVELLVRATQEIDELKDAFKWE